MVQPDWVDTASICMLPPTIVELKVIGVVGPPISTVDISVNSTVVPFHTVQNSPALDLEEFRTVYLPNAAVYDPVA